MIIIPAHTRTIFLENYLYPDSPDILVKVKLNLPEFKLIYDVRSEACFYYPLKDGKQCYSPLPNTENNGRVCIDDVFENEKEALEAVYYTTWNMDFHFSLRQYVEYDANDKQMFINYLNFLTKWQTSGKLDLVVSKGD